MDDFVQRLRMNNIFPSGNNNPLGPPDMNPGSPYDDMIAPLFDMYKKKQQLNTDMQTDAINQNNFKFNTGRLQDQQQKFTAAPQLGAIANSMQQKPVTSVMAHDPTAMTDYQKASIGVEKDKLAQAGSIAAQKGDVAAQGTSIKQKLADYKIAHPGVKIVTQKGGNIQIVDIDGNITDTGVDSGTLSDQDKLELTGEQKLGQIEAQGSNRMEQIGAQGNNRMEQIGAQGKNNLAGIAANIAGRQHLQDTKPGTPTSATQVGAEQTNKINNIMMTRPDLARFIIKDPASGKLTIAPGADPAIANEITQIINTPTAKDINLPSGTPNSTVKTPDNTPKAPAGWKYVAKPDGGFTAVEDK